MMKDGIVMTDIAHLLPGCLSNGPARRRRPVVTVGGFRTISESTESCFNCDREKRSPLPMSGCSPPEGSAGQRKIESTAETKGSVPVVSRFLFWVSDVNRTNRCRGFRGHRQEVWRRIAHHQ